MDYIDRLKKYRKINKISQVELSHKLGLGDSAYGLYETRQRQMDVATFVKICIILKVKPNDVLGFN